MKSGDTVLATARAVAEAIKGQTWGVPDDNGVMYDGEFTGAVTPNGSFVVKIKKKSEKQP